MAVLKQNDGKKWIQSLIALCAILFAYIILSFFRQLGEWFDLEAKFTYFNGSMQAVSVIFGLVSYIVLTKSKKTTQYLEEVYSELVKVIWPDRESTLKLTIGIIIGIVITSIVLGFVDFGIGKVFRLLYN